MMIVYYDLRVLCCACVCSSRRRRGRARGRSCATLRTRARRIIVRAWLHARALGRHALALSRRGGCWRGGGATAASAAALAAPFPTARSLATRSLARAVSVITRTGKNVSTDGKDTRDVAETGEQ